MKTVHAQLGQIMDNRTQKEQNNPNDTSEESGAKTDCQEQNTCHLRSTPAKGWVNQPSHPS